MAERLGREYYTGRKFVGLTRETTWQKLHSLDWARWVRVWQLISSRRGTS